MVSILLYFFIAVVVIQIIYYGFIFSQFYLRKKSESKVKRIGVSVIVCAKNEEKNCRELISMLLEQDYPEYEVVLIDDASTDTTLEIFEEFEKVSSKIKIVKVKNIEAFWGNKKYALTLGIKAAKYNYLLFTDADCLPKSKKWISSMSSHFTSQKTIVLGYGGYQKINNSLLNKLIRLDTVLIATQYFSWAKLGNPYMGIGRNLAYHRSEFFDNNGFINHMKIRSGDDDLFINEVAHKKNTTICYNPESFTLSKPKLTFKDWKKQKKRHLTTGKYYKKMDKMRLILFTMSNFLFITIFPVLLFLQFEIGVVITLIVIRYSLFYFYMIKTTKVLQETNLILLSPILEIILLFFSINLYFLNLINKNSNSWK